MGRERRTELAFMLVPGLLFFGASLRVPQFSGIWHLFPMFPFLMIAMAAGCVCAARRYRWVAGPGLSARAARGFFLARISELFILCE